MPKSRISMSKKCGLLGSNPVIVLAGSKAKIFPTATALILMSLEADAELDEVPAMMASQSMMFSVMGRSLRQWFLVGGSK